MAVKSWNPPGDLPPQPCLAALAKATGWPISTLRLWHKQGAITPDPNKQWNPAQVWNVAQDRFQKLTLDALERARQTAAAQDVVNVDDDEQPTAPGSESKTTVSRGEALTRKHLAQAQKAELDLAERRAQLVTTESVTRLVISIGVEYVEGQQRIRERLAVYLSPEQRRLLDQELQDNANRFRQFLQANTLQHPPAK